MLEAGYDLYGNRRQVFLHVTLPMSMPGVVAGVLLTFIPAAGDFVNAELLGSPQQTMIGNVIQSRYLEVTDYPTAAALSFMLMGLILVMVAVWARIAGTEALMGVRSGGASEGGRPARARLEPERVRGPRDRLPARPDRDRDPVLVQRHARVASTSSGRASRSSTGRTPRGPEGLLDAMQTSVEIAALSTIVAPRSSAR